MPQFIPTDGQQVWIRRWWFSDPFKATWTLATQQFTSLSGLILPWWFVARWRPL
jgi:hypothetical protein